MDIPDNCQKCGLYQYSDKPWIDGRGNTKNPKLIMIGEAPGFEESKSGIPFIGRAGKKLDEMIIQTPGLAFNDIYITNMVKCFPPISTSIPTKGFRVPKESEIFLCKPFLIEEILSFGTENKPILMSLGNVALLGLTGEQSITKELGISKVIGIPTMKYEHNPERVDVTTEEYTLIPNFHPSYVLRNGKGAEKLFIRVLEETWQEHFM